jgi:hypothetical protein
MKPMPTSKTHFEQIPVEVVKKIAIEFPQQDPRQADCGKEWRDLAAQVQTEIDPEKLTDLVRQLIESLDQENRRTSKRMPPTQ